MATINKQKIVDSVPQKGFLETQKGYSPFSLLSSGSVSPIMA